MALKLFINWNKQVTSHNDIICMLLPWRKDEQMMQFKRYKDVHELYKDTYDVLIQNEAQNMILLGNIIIGHKGNDKTSWRDPVNWLMATVSDVSGIQLIALMTPPHNITLYATDNIINPKAIDCLIDGLNHHAIPGVTTEKTLAELIAKEYASQFGLTFKTTMSQRIYELKAVNPDIKPIWCSSFAG